MEALTLTLTEVLKRQTPKSKKGFNQVRAKGFSHSPHHHHHPPGRSEGRIACEGDQVLYKRQIRDRWEMRGTCGVWLGVHAGLECGGCVYMKRLCGCVMAIQGHHV